MDDFEAAYRQFCRELGDTPTSHAAAQRFLAAHPDEASAFWPLFARLTTDWLASPACSRAPDPVTLPLAAARWRRFTAYLLTGSPALDDL